MAQVLGHRLVAPFKEVGGLEVATADMGRHCQIFWQAFQSLIDDIDIILGNLLIDPALLWLIPVGLQLLNQVSPGGIVQLDIAGPQVIEALDGIVVSLGQTIQEISPALIVVCIQVTAVVPLDHQRWTWNGDFWCHSCWCDG